MPEIAPYGTWRSPITSALFAENRLRLGDCTLVGDEVYWAEGRPAEGGRICLVKAGPDGSCVDLIGEQYSARNLVHEYGGRSYTVHGGAVYFVNFSDQRLYRAAGSAEPEPITAEPPVPRSVRYAAPVVSADGHYIYCVRESHSSTDGGKVVNEIVKLPTDGEGEPRVVATGHDFYASPVLSPDGRRLAWTCWDHPQMPWDGTELWEAELGADGLPVSPRLVAGGRNESVAQPRYSPAGELHFISDRSGWWNLYADRGDPADACPLWVAEHDFAEPDWVFGRSSYGWRGDGSIVVTWITGGVFKIGVLSLGRDGARGAGATYDLVPVETPFTSIEYVSTSGDDLVVLAGSSTMASSVVRIDISSGHIEVLRSAIAPGAATAVEAAYLSSPESIEFPTEGGRTAYGLMYPPVNPDFEAPAGELPPLIVVAHGGPTTMAEPVLNFDFQFFTSRGFAVVDVNYGGSSGYGREYRQRLNGQWGVVDLDDCTNAARYLAKAGAVDGRRMLVRGRSAGGYTALCAAVFGDAFAAGASYYGISDLGALARSCHKFEATYTDGLVAPWPAGEEVYRRRSPSHNAGLLHMPIIVFQGLEDAVVPQEQAEIMTAALREKGVPYAYLGFEGEQHGFRQAGTIRRAMEAELCFYGRVLGFDPAGNFEPLEIVNPAALPAHSP